MFELAIFDCDGVLVDSEIISARVHARFLRARGFDISEATLLARFTGVADREMYRIIEAEAVRALPDDHDREVQLAVASAYDHELEAIPGVAEAIAMLDLPRCVASSTAPGKLRYGLQKTGLLSAFEPNIFSATMVPRGKPAPDLFHFAAGQMRTAPHACIVIEDSVAGVTAGVSAGMTVIGFCGGSHCNENTATLLREAGAAIADMADLGKAIAVCESG
jgi:HAD superfamily hydrolase (TIGR01509 family)